MQTKQARRAQIVSQSKVGLKTKESLKARLKGPHATIFNDWCVRVLAHQIFYRILAGARYQIPENVKLHEYVHLHFLKKIQSRTNRPREPFNNTYIQHTTPPKLNVYISVYAEHKRRGNVY